MLVIIRVQTFTGNKLTYSASLNQGRFKPREKWAEVNSKTQKIEDDDDVCECVEWTEKKYRAKYIFELGW